MNKLIFAVSLLIPLYAQAAAPSEQISIGDARVVEGNSGTTDLLFNVQREGGSDLTSNVVIPYTVSPSGTHPATPGVDYIAPPTNATLKIPAGQSAQTLHVPVIGDTTYEPNETLQVQLGKAAALLPGIKFPTAPSFPAGVGPRGVTQGDFNGDGIPDLAVANLGDDTVSILLGKGTGGFSAGTTLTAASGSQPFFILAADFDNDGRIDLAVAANGTNRVLLFKGNGAGGFTALSPVMVGTNPSSIVAGDFNGDGRLDLAVANQVGTVSILRGNGAGGFTVSSTVTVGSNPFSITAHDLDGDGQTDLAVANLDSDNVSILRGNGTGGFSLLRTIALGAGSGPIFVTTDDFDGDGRFDLAVANFDNSTLAILRNTGGGNFAAPVTIFTGLEPFSIVTDDFNGDGHRDLAVANVQTDSVAILLGDGAGGFAAPVNFDGGVGTSSITAGDFDGDGHRDIAVADILSNGVSILLGDGAGGFVAPIHYLVLSPYAVTTGDFNGDGHPDLAVTNQGGGGSLLLGDGAGGFVTTPSGFATGTSPFAVTAGDFDGDGKLDLAVANNGDNNVSIMLGDGAGGFNPQVTYPLTGQTKPVSIAVGYINGDSHLDLAVANNGTNRVSVLLGDGTGRFTLLGSNLVGNAPNAVILADVNGDGYVDLVTANGLQDGNVTIRLGNGTGGFAAGVNYAVGSEPSSVAAGDFDGDGHIDLAVANSADNNVEILHGDGAGHFTPAGAIGVGAAPSSVIAADYDGDGHLDIAVVNNNGNGDGSAKVSILRGDGAGGFAPPVTLGTLANPFGVAIGDFDGDGDLDLAVADNAASSILVSLNQAAKPVAVLNGGTATGTILDDDPRPLNFQSKTDVDSEVFVGSDSQTVSKLSGGSAPISISGSNALYRINGGAYTSAPGTINNGDKVNLKILSATLKDQTVSAVLTVGSQTASWSVTTGTDTTPSDLKSTHYEVTASSLHTSAPRTLKGVSVPVSISIGGDPTAAYQINGGAFTNATGTINPGDTVSVHVMSAPSGQSVTVNLTIGSGSASDVVTSK